MLKIKQCPKNPNLASPIQKKNTTFFFKKLENSSYNLNNDKHKFIKLYLKTKKCKLPEELFLTKYIISKKNKIKQFNEEFVKQNILQERNETLLFSSTFYDHNFYNRQTWPHEENLEIITTNFLNVELQSFYNEIIFYDFNISSDFIF
ncbi:hypothetical protein BNATCHR2118 (nucleomorph) [Bigelowiella natans]|uniref:Uncharacterized protein n=1 Tax=Bigelowiella natans TaxID=227086 RepID=Q3LW22_BIGNA|nr:hypothetical protein BNATCHR2118 [Bigelowiella natans]ABA27343.1 hypothetical protein [Bigelowiella natans]|mmetsp:Transcript_42037/g.67599  ORF Transcript_42037/g.67599 Transcript_42037/m.67599 type:complete len:148 (+) Transcript_42037:70-513(+)